MSPLSPDPDSAHSDPDMMVFPVKKRDPKTVVLKKTKQNSEFVSSLLQAVFSVNPIAGQYRVRGNKKELGGLLIKPAFC